MSLALRGGGALSADTHRKVEEAAARVGYVPNRAGVHLRTGKTNIIALLLDSNDGAIDFVRLLIQGIGQAIRDTRYHLNVTPEFGSRNPVDAVRYVLDNQTADGIIITHTSAQDPRVKLLMERKFPFVTHGRTEFFTPHPSHDFDSELFTRLAVERLVAKGCKNLLLVIGDDPTLNHFTITSAFARFAGAHGVQARILSQKTSHLNSEAIREAGQALAAEEARPDGIICDGEMRTIALVSGLQGSGLMLGRDFHIVSKQTSNILQTIYPTIDTIEEDVQASGMELTRLLIRRIDNESPESLRSLAEPIVHWRS